MRTSRRIWAAIAVGVAVWLLWMTLRPQQQVVRELTPLAGPAAGLGLTYAFFINVLGNIAVFVPLGFAVTQALAGQGIWRRMGGAVAAGMLLSAAIETAQAFAPGRDPALDDWLLNTAGTLLGATLGVLSARVRDFVSTSLFLPPG